MQETISSCSLYFSTSIENLSNNPIAHSWSSFLKLKRLAIPGYMWQRKYSCTKRGLVWMMMMNEWWQTSENGNELIQIGICGPDRRSSSGLGVSRAHLALFLFKWWQRKMHTVSGLLYFEEMSFFRIQISPNIWIFIFSLKSTVIDCS